MSKHYLLGEATAIEPNAKKYPILRVGAIYSGKYGKLDFSQEFINSLIQNFTDGVLEVAPYVDIDHTRGESMGLITGLATADGVLTADIDWNDAGRDAIENKRYLYLSVDIGTAVNSKTGEETYPVLRGIALTNFPVYKDQEILKLSDGQGTPKTAADNIGGPIMDKIIEMVNGLLELIANVPEAEKAAALAKVAEMMQKAGVEIDMGCGPKDKQMSDKATLTLADTLKGEILRLSDELKKSNERFQKLELADKRKTFDGTYVGKKITPAVADKFFNLFLSDEKGTSELLSALPDLNITGETGSAAAGPDMKLSDFDRENMKANGFDPDKPESVNEYMEAVK